MEETRSSSGSEKPTGVKQNSAEETKSINELKEITGGSESQARNIYIYSEIIQQRDAYSYHLE